MEFCSEGDLQRYLDDNQNKLSEKDAIRILKMLMQGF